MFERWCLSVSVRALVFERWCSIVLEAFLIETLRRRDVRKMTSRVRKMTKQEDSHTINANRGERGVTGSKGDTGEKVRKTF